MQKYWVFEAKSKGGCFRLCVAFPSHCQSFDSDGRSQSTFHNTKEGVSDFHNLYTVTSGSVPQWLEKPLPRLWAFWVKHANDTGPEREAVASESRLKIPYIEGDAGYEYEAGESFRSIKVFRKTWQVCGSPDLPDWLKTEAQQ